MSKIIDPREKFEWLKEGIKQSLPGCEVIIESNNNEDLIHLLIKYKGLRYSRCLHGTEYRQLNEFEKYEVRFNLTKEYQGDSFSKENIINSMFNEIMKLSKRYTVKKEISN